MDLAGLDEALARLGAVDPEDRSDPECIRTLLRQKAELDALVAESVAAFDARGEWSLTGARSATAWLRAEARLSGGEARAQVRRGRALGSLPHAGQAWARGAITGDHVDVLAPLLGGATAGDLARDEGFLVDQACTLTHGQFVRAVAYWRQLADPDGTDRAAEDRRARRDAYLVESFSGTWLGRVTLDPVSGTIVSDQLHRLEQLLFEEEWATAAHRLGREPTLEDLARTPGQRRADALVLMARRSGTTPVGGRRPEPLFTVLVGYETMHGRIAELEGGTVVPPGSLLAWLGEAEIERAEYRPDGRVGIGARAKLGSLDAASFERAVLAPVTRVECDPADRCFTGATRRAIEVRDRECCHPHCTVPASRCQVDHVRPYAEQGPTTQENGRLLCGPHNRMRNQRPPPKRE